MSEHMRRSAREERPVRSGFAGAIIAVAVAALVGAVVFVNTRTPATDQAAQAANTTSSTTTDGNKDDSSETAKESADAAKPSTGSSSTQTKDENKQTETKQTGTAKDASSTDADVNLTNRGGATTISGNGSARIGNNYVDENGERIESTNDVSSQSDVSDSSEKSGVTGTSGVGGDGGSSGSTGSGRDATPIYGTDSGWIDAGSCAMEVDGGASGTASDIRWDDDVPQVGLDKSSYPWAHFGEYVEVEYDGMTVQAQIVDCGYYGAGTSGIILNPGVFNQFGAADAEEWGRRDVSYRFV